MAFELKTFLDIVTAVREELGVQSTDTTSINKIKRDVNIIYQEVIQHKVWKWLEKHVDLIHKAYYVSGTCTVTPASTTVTLAVAPSETEGSFAGKLFAADGYSEIYEVDTHTAGSATVVLKSAYTGLLNTTASYKIWTDKIALPTDCKETTAVWHDRYSDVMKGCGRLELRKIISESNKAEGYPLYYYTGDFIDPTPLTAETETDRYRQIQVYPSIVSENVTIHVDYTPEVTSLDGDTDEPLMPVEDRVVLLYGTLAKAWARQAKDKEESARNYALFQAKLARMAGKSEDSSDMPSIQPSSRYLQKLRSRSVGGRTRYMTSSEGSAGSPVIHYLEDVTIDGATLTDNVTVTASKTIDGRDISADGATLDAHVANTTTAHGLDSYTLDFLEDVEELTSKTLSDNTTDDVDTWTVASYDSFIIMYSIQRGASNKETGTIKVATDGTNVSYSIDFTDLGTVGVTFDFDVSAGSLRWRYTTSSTGTAAVLKYKLHKWLA